MIGLGPCCCGTGGPPPTDPCDGSIAVTITVCSRANAAGMSVVVKSGGVPVAPGPTQSGNTFTLTGLCAGTYSVTASATNATPQTFSVVIFTSGGHNTAYTTTRALALTAGHSCSGCCPDFTTPTSGTVTFPGGSFAMASEFHGGVSSDNCAGPIHGMTCGTGTRLVSTPQTDVTEVRADVSCSGGGYQLNLSWQAAHTNNGCETDAIMFPRYDASTGGSFPVAQDAFTTGSNGTSPPGVQSLLLALPLTGTCAGGSVSLSATIPSSVPFNGEMWPVPCPGAVSFTGSS